MRSVHELDHVLGRALAKDPEHRFESCQDFMQAVVDWHTAAIESGTGPGAVATPAPAPTPLPTTIATTHAARRRPMRAVFGAAAAIAAGLLAVVWFARGPVTSDAELAVAAAIPTPQQQVASEAPPVDPSVLWRQQLPSRPISLHTTADGPVAVTGDGAVLLDAATGDPRADLSASVGPASVAADDRVVSADGEGLQAVSAVDGSVLWEAPVDTVAPTVADRRTRRGGHTCPHDRDRHPDRGAGLDATGQLADNCDGRRLIAVDDDGRVATVSVASGAVTYPIDTTVDTPTALAADGNTLYVGQRDGTVLSLDLEAGTTS